MRVLLIGGGGREHAIAWSITKGGGVDELIAIPGNPGIGSLPNARCVRLPEGTSLRSPEGLTALADLAESESIDLTVVGPEDPLVAGIANKFASRGLRLFGPRSNPAKLEGSKRFAKELMLDQGVPTAASGSFEGAEAAGDAKAYLRSLKGPWVVKADGLAAGKGVVVTTEIAEAERWVDECLVESRFGSAGSAVLIEEYLDGPELSLLCLTDGREILPLPPARDHKRLLDDDEGPNTGGMGAYSPVPTVSDALIDQVLDTIVEPVISGISKSGDDFCGVLYTGLVLTEEGPKVLEFNVRFGDPEAQAVLPRLDSDLVEIMLACTEGRLGQVRAAWKQESCVTVVAAASGYPDSPRKGDVISGLDAAGARPGTYVFHAGTDHAEAARGDGDGSSAEIVTAGGRVLAVSALGDDLGQARDGAYEALSEIGFDGIQFRSDIARSAALEEESR
ncbi:MAG: phosphoribosylamine--glycine ligase [Acidobacteria bacterium]|nr:MAG: phosphoribosylamine--glycine ligase [Acidobacteriota bacterium]